MLPMTGVPATSNPELAAPFEYAGVGVGMGKGIGIIEGAESGIPVAVPVLVGGAPRLWASASPTVIKPAAQTRPAHAIFHRESFMGEFLHPSNSVERSGVAIDPIDPSPPPSIPSQRSVAERRRALDSSHCFDEGIAAGTHKSGAIHKYPEFVICAKSG